jgi:hypothetical protein
MRRNILWIAVLGFVVALVIIGLIVFTGGGATGEAASGTAPATVERIEGSDRSRLTLVAGAAERLGLETTPVRTADPALASGARFATTVPYSALLYDAAGKTYVYTSREPLIFVREPVTVELVDSDLVVLSAGPTPGTAVVSVGAAELYGLESGIGE